MQVKELKDKLRAAGVKDDLTNMAKRDLYDMLVKETDRMPSAWLFVVLGIFSGVGNRLLHGLTQAIAARIAPDGKGGFCAVRPLHFRRFRMDNRAVEEVAGTFHFKHDMWLSKLSPAVLIKVKARLRAPHLAYISALHPLYACEHPSSPPLSVSTYPTGIGESSRRVEHCVQG
jgi:hypothetical protein